MLVETSLEMSHGLHTSPGYCVRLWGWSLSDQSVPIGKLYLGLCHNADTSYRKPGELKCGKSKVLA